MAAREGYAEVARDELAALEARLKHNEDFDFAHWRPEIQRLVEHAIVAAYYYDAGAARYALRDDKDVRAAAALLADDARYRQLLAAPRRR